MHPDTTHELAFRTGDGLAVSLLWRGVEQRLSVLVIDERRGEVLELPATAESALDVFYHPYAYAALAA